MNVRRVVLAPRLVLNGGSISRAMLKLTPARAHLRRHTSNRLTRGVYAGGHIGADGGFSPAPGARLEMPQAAFEPNQQDQMSSKLVIRPRIASFEPAQALVSRGCKPLSPYLSIYLSISLSLHMYIYIYIYIYMYTHLFIELYIYLFDYSRQPRRSSRGAASRSRPRCGRGARPSKPARTPRQYTVIIIIIMMMMMIIIIIIIIIIISGGGGSSSSSSSSSTNYYLYY